MGLREAEGEIKSIPIELIKVDEKTGELCIGDKCFMIKYEPQGNEVVIEIDSDAKVCSPLMRKVAKKFLKQITENR